MFAGRFLVRHDPYDLIRSHLAPRLIVSRAIGWGPQVFIKNSPRRRAGGRTPPHCVGLHAVCTEGEPDIAARNGAVRSIGWDRRCPSSQCKVKPQPQPQPRAAGARCAGIPHLRGCGAQGVRKRRPSSMPSGPSTRDRASPPCSRTPSRRRWPTLGFDGWLFQKVNAYSKKKA